MQDFIDIVTDKRYVHVDAHEQSSEAGAHHEQVQGEASARGTGERG